MSKTVTFTTEEVKSLFKDAQALGEYSGPIAGIATLQEAQPGDLSFLGNMKYRSQVEGSRASVILLPEDYEGEPGPDQLYLKMGNPSFGLAQLCQKIEQQLWPKPAAGVHPSAYIDPTAEVHPEAYIGPMCVVDANAVVGAGTVLKAQVHIGQGARVGAGCYFMPQSSFLDYCIAGDRVRLHSGCVIGSDGFGYEFVQGAHKKVPQVGIVRLGSDVEIGANTSVDRARFGETIIGDGTKIDNMVQIGHNVRIGKHCIIVSLSGISGSTIIEDYVIIGGQVGVVGHVRIGQGSKIGAQSGIHHDLKPQSCVRGAPAFPFMMANRIDALKKHIPDLFKRVKSIEKVLQEQSLISQ